MYKESQSKAFYFLAERLERLWLQGNVSGGWMRGLLQLPSFHTKSQVLQIHKHEKHFKVSHNKESQKVEVLARIYFSITG
jgi:hypothetical protein